MKASVVSISLGLFLFFLSYMISSWHNWEPINQKVDLKNKQISESHIMFADMNTRYYIGLSIDRSLPYEFINCLLEINEFVGINCNESKSKFIANWHVKQNHVLIKQGFSTGQGEGSWGAQVSRTLGYFDATEGKKYVVTIHSVMNIEGVDLSDINPRVTVGVHPSQFKDYYVASNIILVLAVIIVLFGVLKLIEIKRVS